MSEAQPVHDRFGLVGTVIAERFRIEREIAEGGFGIVYLGTQVALDRPVAIKVLKTPPGLDEAARKMFHEKFAAEAKTIARLRHPHMVDVYDFGIATVPSGAVAPWMALEWLSGETLDAVLRKRRGRGGQTPAQALDLLRPALEAFGYAHREGIAHRDIKPANIMVVETAHGPVVRVLDFGIAKIMNPDESAGTGHTKTSGMPAFSPQYAAPEQVTFGRTGPWTDVHALGLILTEILTDQPPFPAEDMQLFEQIVAAERPTPAAKGKQVGAWQAIVAKAVALQPTQRWKDANQLLAALTDALGRSPQVAPEPRPASALELGDTAVPVASAANTSPPASPAVTTSIPGPPRRSGRVVVAVVTVAAIAAVAIAVALSSRPSPSPTPAPAQAVVAPSLPSPASAPAPAPPPEPKAVPVVAPAAAVAERAKAATPAKKPRPRPTPGAAPAKSFTSRPIEVE